MQLIDALEWRYATKSFSNEPLTDAQVSALVRAANLAPSSMGLQPFRLVQVRDTALREALVPVSQPKVAQSAAVFIFARCTRIDDAFVDAFIDRVAATRGQPREGLAGLDAMVRGGVSRRDDDALATWATHQAYLSLGTLLTAAAALGIDACPMEGFQPAEVDRILGLSERHLASVVMVAVGHRAPDDRFAKLAKVRLADDEFLVRV